jgi:hypothetical protein
MTSPGIDFSAIIDALASQAMTLGVFETVNAHEPVSAPGTGVTAAVWFQRVGPARAESGLNSTTALLVCNARVYQPILTQPPDQTDKTLVDGVSALFSAYTGEFTLGGLVKYVDVLGKNGVALSAQAGYQNWSDTQYRVITITIPLIINDVWDQSA